MVRLKTRVLNYFRAPFKAQLLEKLLLRFTIGKSFDSALSKIIPNHYQYTTSSMRRVERDKIHYDLDISNLIEWFIYFGMREKSKVQLFDAVKPGDIVIDVGVNVGETLLNFAKRVGPAGKVIGFEPDPISIKKCKKNVSLNDFHNIVLENLALSNVERTYTLSRTDSRNPGANMLHDQVRANTKDPSQVRATKLDSHLDRLKIRKLDLIKIDVEGFELNVLKGAIETITAFRPKLFIELSDTLLRNQGTSSKELVLFLEKLNYRIQIAETGEIIKSTHEFEGKHFDIECISAAH